MLTKEQRAAIREVAEKATKGKWEQNAAPLAKGGYPLPQVFTNDDDMFPVVASTTENHDAAHIVSACNNAVALCDTIDRLEAYIKQIIPDLDYAIRTIDNPCMSASEDLEGQKEDAESLLRELGAIE